MRKHCRTVVCLRGAFKMDRISINFDHHNQSIFDDDEIGLDPPIIFATFYEDGERRERDPKRFQGRIEKYFGLGAKQKSISLPRGNIV